MESPSFVILLWSRCPSVSGKSLFLQAEKSEYNMAIVKANRMIDIAKVSVP